MEKNICWNAAIYRRTHAKQLSHRSIRWSKSQRTLVRNLLPQLRLFGQLLWYFLPVKKFSRWTIYLPKANNLVKLALARRGTTNPLLVWKSHPQLFETSSPGSSRYQFLRGAASAETISVTWQPLEAAPQSRLAIPQSNWQIWFTLCRNSPMCIAGRTLTENVTKIKIEKTWWDLVRKVFCDFLQSSENRFRLKWVLIKYSATRHSSRSPS